MRQFTETYRIKLTKETRYKLDKLKAFNIVPAKFIRLAIEQKLASDLPKLKPLQKKETLPF